MGNGMIPNAVHGKHAEINTFDIVHEMVDSKLKEQIELGSKAPYAYTLGFTQIRLALILNFLKYRDPEILDEIMEEFFNV